MTDPVLECRIDPGTHKDTQACPFNSNPSKIWRDEVNAWDWVIPDTKRQPPWKSGTCPRCGHDIVVKMPPDGAPVGAQFEGATTAFVFCNCGQEHPGGTGRKGCGQSGDITAPETR